MTPVRLYLVEDQAPLLRTLVKMLSLYPDLAIVGTAENGERAVEEIPRAGSDVVLLDLELPGMDGLEVTRTLKARGVAAQVLILTTFDDEAKVYQAMCAGASGYLVKRVGPSKIHASVHEVMAGGTVLEPIIARRFWNYFSSLTTAHPAAPPPDPWGLTDVEREVLRYVAKGLSNAEVGRVMQLERRTIRTHLEHVYRKMGVNSHVEAVVQALRAGVVSLSSL